MNAPTGEDQRWVRRFHPRPDSRVRLACFPHAGGAASYWFPLSRSVPDTVEVVSVQYPGRQDRRTEPFLTSVESLADEAFTALRPLLDRPLALFGHSMGASIAFEVAVRLKERLDVDPVALFASGRRAPSRYRHQRVHELDDDGLVAELGRLDGTDTALLRDPEMREMILPAVRADYTAAETYRWTDGSRLACPIVVLVGDADPQVDAEEAAAWADHTTGPFALHTFPGGHFYLTDHQPEIVEIVTAVC